MTYMAINSIIRSLVSHDSSSCVVDHYIDPVCLACNLICRGLDLFPIGQITLQPHQLVGCFLAHFLFNRSYGSIDDLFGDRKNEHLLDIVREHGMGTSRTNTLRATCDDRNFPS